MIKTIKERNEEAVVRMKKSYQQHISQNSDMSIRDVLQFGSAILAFSVHCATVDTYEYSQLGNFLLASVDTLEVGIGVQPRYKLIEKYDWAMNNAYRDWNNRYEMGQ